jgi:SWI/SNF-related matrix-associated actin-dependent regulator of chromatin subfamily A3
MGKAISIVSYPLSHMSNSNVYRHLRPGLLKCHIYHGQNRKDVKFLAKYDVVITTYQTVSAIWRQKQQNLTENSESIFSIVWHRVVLDEGKHVDPNRGGIFLTGIAHTIQNQQSQLTQACFALHSNRRWAITGTPIQNKLTDFLSIIKFLRVYPYSELGTFEADISKPWQKGDPQGFLRLRTLVRNITISRTKAVVDLPPRVDEIHHLDFSFEERQKYDLAKTQTAALLEEAISSANQQSTTFNALERLNLLRLICSHGLLTQTSQTSRVYDGAQGAMTPLNNIVVQESFADMPWTAIKSCSNCGIDLLDDVLAGFRFPNVGACDIQPPRMLCEGCYFHISAFGSGQMLCDQYMQFQDFDVTTSSSPAPFMPIERDATSIDSMSTKVKALVADLLKNRYNEKRSVPSYLPPPTAY